jgi:hypothetical protein
VLARPAQLGEFIDTNQTEILRRCRTKVARRLTPAVTELEMERGLPRFLADLVYELGDGPSQDGRMTASATQHGADLFMEGFTIGQVVHDYGAVCQSITDLAVETHAVIGTDDFRTLNRCLDNAIAMAVAEYARHQLLNLDGQYLNQSLTVRNLIETALNGFEVLQAGTVGVTGTTGALVHRSLLALRDLA